MQYHQNTHIDGMWAMVVIAFATQLIAWSIAGATGIAIKQWLGPNWLLIAVASIVVAAELFIRGAVNMKVYEILCFATGFVPVAQLLGVVLSWDLSWNLSVGSFKNEPEYTIVLGTAFLLLLPGLFSRRGKRLAPWLIAASPIVVLLYMVLQHMNHMAAV